MRYRLLILFAFLIAAPLMAFDRGHVIVQYRPSSEAWELDLKWQYAYRTGGTPAIQKNVPYLYDGHFLIPMPDQAVFHSDGTVSVWDGVPHYLWEPGLGYTELFHRDGQLGEIAPMRSGHFLLPDDAKLIELSLQGVVREIPFPNGVGAAQIELLADQCTLLYGVANRVARMDICTGEALSDFAAMPIGTVRAIRKLPNGDVLVANGSAITQLSADGAFVRLYPFDGVTHIALTPDGSAFWAAGADAGQGRLRYFAAGSYGEGQEVRFDNAATRSVPADAVDDLLVVGEWRAAAPPLIRVRAVR